MMSYAESADGVRIAYVSRGDGEPALAFIHGGLADRTFWDRQVDFFGERGKVIALDLAGHGTSDCTRHAWTMKAFADDVLAVLAAERVDRAVLIGNSLGGPVAIEAALLAPERIIGVIGVDTFHELNQQMNPSEVEARAEEFRADFAGSVRRMTRELFHSDADPAVVSDAEQRMSRAACETASGMFDSLKGYDLAASARRLRIPLRCINGDLYPVNFEGNRSIHADFRAVVLPHTGHYPMLECPEEFNRQLAIVMKELLEAGTKERPAH